MNKNKKIFCIIIIILVIICGSKLFLTKTILAVKKSGTNIAIRFNKGISKDFSTNISTKNIESIDYLKEYLLYESKERYGDKFYLWNKTYLYNGDKNVQVYAMNDKGSGIYIKTTIGTYLIACDTTAETLDLYNELKEDKDFNIKYKK